MEKKNLRNRTLLDCLDALTIGTNFYVKMARETDNKDVKRTCDKFIESFKESERDLTEELKRRTGEIK